MTDVLLKELTNSDIEWILSTGTQKQIPAGTVLFYQGQAVQALYILLDGALAVSTYQIDDTQLDCVSVAIENSNLSMRTVAELTSGEMVGEFPFLKTNISTSTVTILKDSLILFIPLWEVTQKLQQDTHFAAHLYRAIAILLFNQLEKTINQLSNNTKASIEPELKEILLVFALLQDSDIDWMISAGKLESVDAGKELIHPGRPVEALYILLDGKLVLAKSEDKINRLTRAFSRSSDNQSLQHQYAFISRGGIVGETSCIEVDLSSTSVRAVEECLVLSIPKWRLAAKLLHDINFAVRFYRVIAISLADKQQAIVNRSGYGKLYTTGQPLDEYCKYENELSTESLLQVSIAANRFDWMLRKIQHG
jgi:bacteriocin-type transport-associated protein